LAIKRRKSLLNVDLLQVRNGSPLADLWLHGKLLYALLVDKRLRRTMGDNWGRLVAYLEADAHGVGGADQWRALLAGAAMGRRRTGDARRPRRRTLQRLSAALCPLPVPDCIATTLDQSWNEEWKRR
jgi:hypothetical protein